jgi:hypothetical protein
LPHGHFVPRQESDIHTGEAIVDRQSARVNLSRNERRDIMAFIAALLGIVGGIVGLTIGVGLDTIQAGPNAITIFFADLTAVKFASVAIPLASLVGGIVSRAKPLIGGVLMLLGAGGMAIIFEIDYPTELAVAASGIGAMMAIYANSRVSESAVVAPAE